MSEQPDSGGPAFPTDNEQQTGPNTYHFAGLSLRDYFAAKAMQGLLAAGADYDVTDLGIADSAYKIADAMIAERSAK